MDSGDVDYEVGEQNMFSWSNETWVVIAAAIWIPIFIYLIIYH